MGDWVEVCSKNEVGPGQHKVVDVDGAMVAVFNLNGDFYAIEDVCTHDGSEIAIGCIIGDDIECPRHGARFCIKTGAVTAPPAYEPIDTFPVMVQDQVVYVQDNRWD